MTTNEDARLESLGYQPQLNRVLGLFANFAVAFAYLSPAPLPGPSAARVRHVEALARRRPPGCV